MEVILSPISKPLRHTFRIAAVAIALAAGSSARAGRAIEWTDFPYTLRSGEIVPAQIGSLEVPTRRDVANASTTKIRFVRLRSTGDRKSTRLNSSHLKLSRMPSSA